MEASPAPSTSQNQQRQTAPATGPQIRSRITVVCAECKRLKLKCDRNTPCGKCVSRDTVDRCKYAEGAAEKVDLHSLNNRISRIEQLFAPLLSQGTLPSTALAVLLGLDGTSTAPLDGTLPALPLGQNLTQHVHHHHTSASALSSDSISLSQEDLAAIWLDELEAALLTQSVEGVHHGPPLSNNEHVGQIKLEPAPSDDELSHMDDGANSSIIDVDQAPSSAYPFSGSPSSTWRREAPSTSSRPTPPIPLPALTIYYHFPPISPPGTSTAASIASPSHPSANPGLPSLSYTSSANTGVGLAPATTPSVQSARPQVTPALLKLLPPVSTCEQYLVNAHDVVFSVRPVPFQYGWSDFKARSLAMLTDDGQPRLDSRKKKPEGREKEKEKEKAQLAMRIYFGGVQRLQDTDMDVSDAGASNAGPSRSFRSTAAADVVEEEHSLPFFAAVCTVLAIGASVSPQSTSLADVGQDAPSFLHALAQQALGVWDTTQANASQSQDEGEKLDSVLASLLGCAYILLSTAAQRRPYGYDDVHDGPSNSSLNPGVDSPIVASVGRLVKAARALDLGGEAVSKTQRSDTALGTNGEGSKSGKKTRKEQEAERERLKEEWKRAMWWDVMWYDLFTSDVVGEQPHIPSKIYAAAQPPPCAAYPADEDNHLDDDNEASEDRTRAIQATSPVGDAYSGARHRLIQLVYRLKSHLAQPDCCCGYTLDQAAALEGRVRQWQSTLPIQLRHSSLPDSGPEQPLNSFASNKVLFAQTCELAVIANLLVIRIYAPFIRKQEPLSNAAQPMTGGLPPPLVNIPASKAILHACQAVTRVMSDLHTAYSSPGGAEAPQDYQKSNLLPCLFDFYPPEKVVFDSVAICAHATVLSKEGGPTFDVSGLRESIHIGLGLLSKASLAPPYARILDALRVRLSANGGGGVKRRHSQVDMSGTPTNDHTPRIGVHGPVVPGQWSTQSTQTLGGHHSHVPSPLQQSHQIIELRPPSPVVPSTPLATVISQKPVATSRAQEKQEQSLTAATSKTSTATAKTPQEASQKDKEKKEKVKKSAPVVGIRVRPGKQPDKPRPVTLAPRPPATPSGITADTVRSFRQKLQPQTPSSKHSVEQATPLATPFKEQNTAQGDSTMRSRSSSVSFQSPEQRADGNNQYPSLFIPQVPTEMSHSHPTHSQSIAHPQHQHQTPPQGHASSEMPLAHTPYIQPQSMEYHNPAFENTPTTSITPGDSMVYGSNNSSPFANTGPPPSDGSSPLTSGSGPSPGNPSTPSFMHHPALPGFGPQQTSATYIQMQSPSPFAAHYGPSYGGNHQMHGSMALSDVVMDQPIGGTSMYGSSQHHHHHPHQMQDAPFDRKQGVEHHQTQMDFQSHPTMQQPLQQSVEDYRRGDTDHDMMPTGHPSNMDMAPGPWTGPNHPQMPENQSMQYAYQPWNNGGPPYSF